MNPFVVNFPHGLVGLNIATQVPTITGAAATLESFIGGGFTFSTSCKYVQVAIETAAVRVEPGGQTPTASIGQPVAVGQIVLLSLAEAKAAKWIRSTGVSATAQVSQYTV